MQDSAVRADVVCVPEGKTTRIGHDAVCPGDLLSRVAKDRIVEFQGLSKRLVLVRCVATGCKVGNLEFPQGIAALTERLAFLRSATGKRFRVPRDHDDLLAGKIRQLVRLSVAA